MAIAMLAVLLYNFCTQCLHSYSSRTYTVNVIVTHPLYESRMHWIPDPTPPPPRRTGMDYSDPLVQSSDHPVQIHSESVCPRNTPVKSRSAQTKSRTPPVHTSDTQASAIATSAPPGAPFALPLPKKCRRRRRRKARRAANDNAAPHSAAPVTPDERWANQNAGFQRATQHQPEASDPTQMKSAAVYKDPNIQSHPFTQPPISATNRNSSFTFGLERCEIPGLYKPAFPDLRQDLTAGTLRVNNSGSSLSSPSHLHPYTKPFSGRPARPYMTCPTWEAGGALRETWDSLPAVAARPTPRHQRRHRSRSARSCCCWTESPATHGCWYVGPQASRNQRHRPGDALPGSPPASAAVIALQECSGRPSACRPMDTGVINTTLCYKQS